MADELRKVAQQYSQAFPVMNDASRRRQKGMKVLAILKDTLQGKPIEYLLDVGCSNALLLDVVVEGLKPKLAIGFDLDRGVLPKPTSQRITAVGDVLQLPVAPATVDVVLCNHTYEHVPDARRLFEEIHRVLKPGGVVYFSAMNARWPIEPHYHLPFVHWLPKRITDLLLRLLGHTFGYVEQPLSTPRLRQLVSAFDLQDYTVKVITEPAQYAAQDNVPATFGPVLGQAARLLYGILPGYLWVLRKRQTLE